MEKRRLKKFYLRINSKIKNNKFLMELNLLLVPVLKYFYFQNERLLIKGKNITKSNKQSVLFFTAHKCGSTYINGIIERLGSINNVIPVHFSNYFDGVDNDPIFNEQNFLNNAFKSKGYYYGAFRKFHPIPNIDDYKILVVLRDPRDVLTSHYFSTLFNHPLVRRRTLENRKLNSDLTIDEYVIKFSDEFLHVYQTYIDELLNKPNVLFLKYEEMITVFDNWLPKMAKHVGFTDDNEIIDKIVSESNFTVKKEDPNSFIRNIKAGDHLDKLKPKTILELNMKFENVLKRLGYDYE